MPHNCSLRDLIILSIYITNATLLKMLEYHSGKILLSSPYLNSFSDIIANTKISYEIEGDETRVLQLIFKSMCIFIYLIASSLSIIFVPKIILELNLNSETISINTLDFYLPVILARII